jgi:two-component system nitrogen regulation sensor histidine kinase NtrY
MHPTPSATLPEPADAPAPAKLRPAFFRGTSKHAVRTLGLVVVLLSVFVSSASFLIMTGATDIEPTPEVWTLIWIVNGLLVLLVIALVLTEATLLLQARFRKEAGAGLQVRMVTMFAVVAAVPAALVAVVATISLNQGLDQWFSERTLLHARARPGAARRHHLGRHRTGAGAGHL